LDLGPFGGELSQILTGSTFYEGAVRLVRQYPDLHDKSRDFRRDVLNAIQAERFESEEFVTTPAYDNYDELLEATINRVKPTLTTWVELGVGSGATTKRICRMASRLGRDVTLRGVDCDLYTSTKIALDALSGALQVDTVLFFDEYY